MQAGPQRHHGERQLEGDRRLHRGGDQWDDAADQIVSCDASGTKYVLGPAVFEGTQLTGVSRRPAVEQHAVGRQPDAERRRHQVVRHADHQPVQQLLPAAAGSNENRSALDSTAIVLDGNVQAAPMTQGALTSGSFTISGPQPSGFTEDQANQLTNILKYGSLPLNFIVQERRSRSHRRSATAR